MGTRGFVGVVVDGVEHIAYNGMSSGPDCLGLDVLADLKALIEAHSPAQFRALAARLTSPAPFVEYVDGVEVAHPGRSVREVMAQFPEFAAFVNEQVAAGYGPRDRTLDDSDERTWQWWGDFTSLEEMLIRGVYQAHPGFPLDSLFCEWGYLIDLDRDNGPDRPTGVLEVYVGFQTERPEAGRWANRPTREEEAEDYAFHLAWCAENGRDPWRTPEARYKAVAPVASWALDSLPTEDAMLALYEAWRNKTLTPFTGIFAA